MAEEKKIIRVAAGIIRDGERIFATQRGYGQFKGGWEFPGGKIEYAETPSQALMREIKEELDVTVKVGPLVDTVEYDYPDFHLSMNCYFCTIRSGQLVLKEHAAAKWLTRETLNSVEWLPADLGLIEKLKVILKPGAEFRSVLCGEREIGYLLARKSVKNINLRIKPDGMVLISANRRVSVGFIENFIKSRQDFIFHALDKYVPANRKPERVMQYKDGERFLVLGQELELKVIEGEKDAVDRDGDFVCLTVKDTQDEKRRERCVKRWIQELEVSVFHQVCKETYPVFQKYGVDYPEIKIRTMKTMWGSCRPERGIITLNSRLIETPMRCIEYVVLHEFAHFIHPNHSAEFYQLVAKYMPDWKVRKKELEQYI